MPAFMARAVGLLMAGLLSGCSGGSGRPSCPAGEQCVNAAISTDPYTLDPNKWTLSAEVNIIRSLLVGLTMYDADGRAVPGMATHWSTSADGLTWTFHMREAKWSDGRPVTATDIVTSLRRHVDPKTASPWPSPLYVIAGAQDVADGKAAPETIGAFAPDPRTVVIRLRNPAPYLAELMAGFGFPVPTHALRKWGDRFADTDKYLSNGPYLLASRAMGDRIVLTANPAWFGQRPCFDRVSLFVTPSLITAERQVQSGEMDLSTRFALNRAPLLRRTMPAYVRSLSANGFTRVAMNLANPALRDIRVRQALAMAIDRQFLADKVAGAGALPMTTVSPPTVPGYAPSPPAWASWTQARRVETAKDLMRRAGYSRRNPLRLEYKYPSSQPRSTGAFLQSEWRAIGAEVTLTSVDISIHFNEMAVRNFELGYDNYSGGWIDPAQFLELNLKNDPNNYPGYANPAFNETFAAANRQANPQRRLEMLAQAEEIANADLPNIPLYTYVASALVNPAITGFNDNPNDIHPPQFWCRKQA